MDHAVVAPIFWGGEVVAWTGNRHARGRHGRAPARELDRGRQRRLPGMPADAPDSSRRAGRAQGRRRGGLPPQHRTPTSTRSSCAPRSPPRSPPASGSTTSSAPTGKTSSWPSRSRSSTTSAATVRQRLRELPGRHLVRDRLPRPRRPHQRHLPPQAGDDQARRSPDLRLPRTDPQAPGPINCAWSGTVGGILQISSLLCYDTPWSHGAVMDCIEIISEPGTLNNATFPAAVSMATVQACQLTGNLVVQAVSKMYGCSDAHKGELIATRLPRHQRRCPVRPEPRRQPLRRPADRPGRWRRGPLFPRRHRHGGSMISPSYAIPNAERIESLYPLLVATRRKGPIRPDPASSAGGPASSS